MSMRSSAHRSPHRTPPRFAASRLTPGKRKSPFIADRFIPSRSAADFDYAHYVLTSGRNDELDVDCSPAKREFSKAMSENLAGSKASNGKILHFVSRPPGCPNSHESSVKAVYKHCTSPKTRRVARAIPQVPERILDAPEVVDDFYLNLVDWGKNNQLVVALGGCVYMWNASSGQTTQLLEMDSQDDFIASVAWSHNSDYLAVGSTQNTVQLWDVASMKRVRTMKSHSSRTQCLAWNGSTLSSGSADGSIHQHDVRVANHLTAVFSAHCQGVCGLNWSCDGKLLASGGNDNMVNIWKAGMSTGCDPLHTLRQHQAAVKAVRWCPWQNSLLATGGGTADRFIRLWNASTGQCLAQTDTKSQVSGILWSREHRELVSSHGFSRNQLTIWRYPNLIKVTELEGHTSRILCLAMSPDGSHVVSLGADETLRIWNCFAPKQTTAKKAATADHTICAIRASRIR